MTRRRLAVAGLAAASLCGVYGLDWLFLLLMSFTVACLLRECGDCL